MTARSIARVLQSRTLAIIFMVTSFVVTMVFCNDCGVHEETGVDGLVFSLVYPVSSPFLPTLVNYSLYVGIALIMVLINREFKLVRSASWYFVTLFFIVILSFAQVTAAWNMGAPLAFLLCLGAFLLFSIYSSPSSTTTVFLIFFLISLSSLWITSAIFFFPVFIVGLWQMKIISPKALIAMILGIVTPFWIIWGFEWAEPFRLNFTIPFFGFRQFITATPVSRLVSMLVMLLACIVFLIAVAVKALSYNAGRRSFNGFISLLTLTLICLLIIDVNNANLYIPVLVILFSFLVSHYFFSRNTQPSIPGLMFLPILFIALAVWNFL